MSDLESLHYSFSVIYSVSFIHSRSNYFQFQLHVTVPGSKEENEQEA